MKKCDQVGPPPWPRKASLAPRMARRARPFWSLPAVLATVAAVAPAQEPARTVDSQPLAKALADAAQIDRLVEADLAAHGQRPHAPIDDAAFLRRVYLDAIGRIPTAEEAQSFLGAKAAGKRRALIDALLDSPGHQSHEFHWWADLLRAKSRLVQQISGEPYLHWIKQALADNAPYDRMVRELLTATGPAHARGNGATGYYLRDRGMPLDNMANTVRVFLGTRLECAQCHNHPFDQWTQRQFYEMAAFTGGLRYTADTLRRSDEGRKLLAFGRELGQQDAAAARALRRMLRTYTAGVSGSGTGRMRLPDDYKYEDEEPGQFVAAHAMFGATPALQLPVARAERRRPAGARGRDEAPDDAGSRAAFADWLTAPDNPRFTVVAANRLWKRLFGLGVIEPVDGMTEATPKVNVELMTCLAKVMVEVGYDLRQFQRVLLNTKTYQRAAATRTSPDAPYRFPGPLLRRMSPEQMWDSLLTLVVEDIDCTIEPPGARAEAVYARHEELARLTPEALQERLDQEALRETDPARYRALLQAERRAEVQRRRGAAAVRASDLPSPAPPGHPLRQFGQSDREQIETASTEANVPQALTLINGFADQQLMRPGTVLGRGIAAATSPRGKVEAAFLALLCRAPTADELALWARDVERDGDAALRDLIWTLVNAHEFRFVQ